MSSSAAEAVRSAFACASALFVIGALLTGCAQPPPQTAAMPPCCRELKPGTSFTVGSLYQLESEWTSDVGRTVRLGVLAGRPQVVTMFFTRCEFTCPVIVNDLRRIEQALPEAVRGQVDFLLVSMDAARDTPEQLDAYRQTQKLPATHWTLLRGETEDVRELAALLGVNYRQDARGQFAHSNLITLLNANGEIVYQLAGVNSDVTPLIDALARLPRP